MVHSALVTRRTPLTFVSVRYSVSSRDGWPPTRSAFRACTVSRIVPPLPSEKLIDVHDLYFALIWPLSTVAAWLLAEDRKSTRLNSSHGYISYAVFCLKKQKT